MWRPSYENIATRDLDYVQKSMQTLANNQCITNANINLNLSIQQHINLYFHTLSMPSKWTIYHLITAIWK